MGNIEMHTKFWLENLKGGAHFGRLIVRHRWEDNIKIYLKEIGM
jgi:hypothetical protein